MTMAFYKPVKSNIVDQKEITIKTETGHTIIFKITPSVFVDLDSQTEDKKPFFYVTFENDYVDTKSSPKAMSAKTIRKKYIKANLLTEELVYDHIQLGFVYADKDDPNNHKWMLNFMDVNNNYLFGHHGEEVKLDCPFTTMSWEDGNWHGRFIIAKKDVESLTEPVQGFFVLKGKGTVGDQKVTPLENGIDTVSLRFNVYENSWYCEYMQDGKSVGKTPCKNIICDVPFVGKVDKASEKPKVTAELKAKDIKGISVALNALIIKRK